MVWRCCRLYEVASDIDTALCGVPVPCGTSFRSDDKVWLLFTSGLVSRVLRLFSATTSIGSQWVLGYYTHHANFYEQIVTYTWRDLHKIEFAHRVFCCISKLFIKFTKNKSKQQQKTQEDLQFCISYCSTSKQCKLYSYLMWMLLQMSV